MIQVSGALGVVATLVFLPITYNHLQRSEEKLRMRLKLAGLREINYIVAAFFGLVLLWATVAHIAGDL